MRSFVQYVQWGARARSSPLMENHQQLLEGLHEPALSASCCEEAGSCNPYTYKWITLSNMYLILKNKFEATNAMMNELLSEEAHPITCKTKTLFSILKLR